MDASIEQEQRHNKPLIASLLLATMIYLSTPYLTLMSPSGILDALSSTTITLAFCHMLLVLPRRIAIASASVLTLSAIAFNIANRFYFEQQQTFLSIHTLYLASETLTYLKALPTWQLISGSVSALLLLLVLIAISGMARPSTLRSRVLVAACMVVLSVVLQIGYARITVEAKIKRGDNAPLGHMARSTGYVPFIGVDVEIAAMRERAALVNRLRTDPSIGLPEKYSAARMGELLGYGSGYESIVSDARFPLHRVPARTLTTNDQPASGHTNVLLLVLESVRASEMGVYGAELSATPFLDSLANQNVFAEKFYATSNFTVKSEHAIHCSSLDFMVGQPMSKRELPVKSQCMPAMMREKGYQTLWFHGNNKEFYSRDEYLPKLGFDEIWSRGEIDPNGSEQVLGWGLSDPFVLDFALNTLEAIEDPFYAEIMTVSNHMPFDYDWDIDFPAYLQSTKSMHERYRRGIYYTDRAVKRFYEQFLESPLSDNTILIVTGDHGIWTFGSDTLSDLGKNERFFRVPFIMTTPDGLKRRIRNITSHLDIAPTISQLMNLSGSDDYMGQDLLGSNPHRHKRVNYLMTEQALSYRYADLACIPTIHCQGGEECYRDTGGDIPSADCYSVLPGQDLLLDDQAHPVARSSIATSRDRALFDYSQIALELGTSPMSDQPALNAAVAAGTP